MEKFYILSNFGCLIFRRDNFFLTFIIKFFSKKKFLPTSPTLTNVCPAISLLTVVSQKIIIDLPSKKSWQLNHELKPVNVCSFVCLFRPHNQMCPVCKAGISRDKVVPLYGRGNSEQKDPRDKPIPPRPRGQRSGMSIQHHSYF